MMKLLLLFALATLAALSFAAPILHEADDDEAFLAALKMTVKAESQSDVQTTMESSRPVRYIRITQPAPQHLCFSWVACYDQAGSNVCANRNPQFTTSGNCAPYADPWGLSAPVLSPVENSVKDAGNAYCSATPTQNNYWQLDLGVNGVDLKQIKYRPRNDAPVYSFGVVITIWDKDMKLIEGPGTTFTASASLTTTQTFDITGTGLGYTGTYDEHLAPVVALLEQLKVKLMNSKKITADQAETMRLAAKTAQDTADKATGAWNEAKINDFQQGERNTKELALLDNIMMMVHTLNGKK